MKNFHLVSSLYASIFFLGIFASEPAKAVYVVDTGPGPGPDTALSGIALGSTEWLAGEIILDQPYTITGVEGWMIPADGAGTLPITIVMYTDGGEIPGTEIFSANFSIDSSGSVGWYGVSGLVWDITAGSYWVSFEPRQCISPCTPLNDQALVYGPATTPLENYAFNEVLNGVWLEEDTLGMGIRVSAIPVPTALWLFVSGLLGLVGISRYKKAT
jgi:hypothetical protein